MAKGPSGLQLLHALQSGAPSGGVAGRSIGLNAQLREFSANLPLVDRYIKQIDERVGVTAFREFVGAKVLPSYVVNSEGARFLEYFDMSDMKPAVVDMDGLTEQDDAVNFSSTTMRLPVTHKGWRLLWRDLKASRSPADRGLGKTLETGNAEMAARQVLLKVDQTIFNGDSDYGISGLTTVSGRNQFTGTDWSIHGNAYDDLTDMGGVLDEANHHGPYLAVTLPTRYTDTLKVFVNSGTPQKSSILEYLEAGLFKTPTMTESAVTSVLMSQGSDNADLVTATEGPVVDSEPYMKYVDFWMYDITAPRIRRPKAIITGTGQ